MNLKNASTIFTLLSTLLFPLLGAAQAPKPVFQDDKGVAIHGTDVVAYFTLGEPTKGKPEFAHQWNGATWHFANAEHFAKFQADPEKYAPQFGGYCSYAVAKGKTASVSPKAWTIVDGKLYLNHSLAQGLWKKDVSGNIEKGNANWPKVKAGEKVKE